MNTLQERMQLSFRIQEFYYQEARLLDERQYRQWLALLSEDIRYTMPARHTPQLDNRLRGLESMLETRQEISGTGPDSTPFREENYLLLSMRAERAYKRNAWTDNPPARTRRMIHNIEVMTNQGNDTHQVKSNFQLHYSRHGNDNFIYSGMRNDALRVTDTDIKITSREVILDWNIVVAPTLGLFF